MINNVCVACAMLQAFENYLFDREHTTFLFHDEITGILHDCHAGSVIDIWDFPDISQSFTVSDNPTGKEFINMSDNSKISIAELTETIYEAVKSEQLVTIDEQDILEM